MEYDDNNNNNDNDNTDHYSETDMTMSPYFKSGDFIELICCLIFCVLCLLPEILSITPRQRPIPFQLLDSSNEYILNLSFNEQSTQETIPDWLLIVLAVILPIALQIIISQWILRRNRYWHKTLCVYFVGMGLTFFATAIIKVYVGNLRPDFYQSCLPSSDYSTCTQPSESNVKEARRSFPSGHASISFCGLGLFSLFLQNECFGQQSKWVSSSSHQASRLRWNRLYLISSLVPIVLAFYISASRIVDNFHFPADVVGGAMIGSFIAMFSHGLWFIDPARSVIHQQQDVA